MIRVGQGFWVFNFRYTVFLCLKLSIKYSLPTNFGYKVYRVFLNFGILVFWYFTRVLDIFGILKGLFLVFWYSLPPSPPPGRPWLTYYLLYKTPNKNMSVCLSVCLSVYGVTCPMKCSCNRIHQPLLSFYCHDVTFSTSI